MWIGIVGPFLRNTEGSATQVDQAGRKRYKLRKTEKARKAIFKRQCKARRRQRQIARGGKKMTRG